MAGKNFNYKKTLKWVNNGIFTLLLMVLAVLVFFMVSSKTTKDGIPKIDDYSLMVVLSGSMSPVFEAGDVIVVAAEKKDPYAKGDIITFRDPEDANRIVTHRIVEVVKNGRQVYYRTKGDANDSPDAKLVPAGNVLGRQKWRIPYLGRITEFAKTRQGFIFFIIVPGFLIIVSELRNIGKAISEEIEKKKREA